MKRLLLPALALAALACSKPPPGKVVYSPADGAFSCEVPEHWRLLEAQGGAHRVSFYGPEGSAVDIYFYGSKGYPSAQAYAAMESSSGGTTSPLRQEKVGDRTLDTFTTSRTTLKLHSREQEQLEEQSFLLPAADGFYSVVLVAPADSFERARPAYLELVASFKPRR